jgi:hypothetical protein
MRPKRYHTRSRQYHGRRNSPRAFLVGSIRVSGPSTAMGAFGFDNFDLKSTYTLLSQLNPKRRSRLL